MKLHSILRWVLAAIIAGACFIPAGSLAKPRPPLPPWPEAPLQLWNFDAVYWVSLNDPELSAAAFNGLAEGWSGFALERNVAPAFPLVMPGLDSNGHTNLVTAQGSIRFWFSPSWSSTALGGKGPGYYARLAELVAADGKSGTVAWSWYASPDGSTLFLSGQTEQGPEDFLKAEIQFEAERWYLLTLSCSPMGTALYVNGQLAAEGTGLPAVNPALAGLVVGSDLSGANVAGGLLDEVATFGQPATPENQVAYYNAVSGQAALGPISPEEEEAALKGAEEGAGIMRAASSEPFEPCVTNGPVYLTNIVAVLDTNQSWTVSFTILGGTMGVPYDIFATTNLIGSHVTNSQWAWLDVGYTCYRYTFTNQPDTNTFYILGTPLDSDGDGLTDAYEQLVSKTLISTNDTDGDQIPDGWEVAHGLNPLVNDAGEDPDDDGATNLQEYQNNTDPFDNMLVVWGDNASGQGTVPWGFGPVAAMAGGGGRGWGGHTLVVTNQGRVSAWGANDFGQATVPANLSNVVAVVAGGDQSAARKSDGTVVQWGRTNVAVPSTVTNVTALSAGYQHFLALRADGTVVAWGNTNSPADTVPSGLNGVAAISAGWNHNLALRTNGTVVVWGLGGQALGWNLTNAPGNLTNIAAIAAGALHSVGLRNDGTVVAWGSNTGGETNVPTGLSNVVAIAAGRGYSLALRGDGSFAGWGLGLPVAPPELAGLTSIAAGPGHALATRRGVLTPLIVSQPRSRGVAAGGTATFEVAVSSRRQPAYQWQFNATNNIADATNATLSVTNVQASNQGLYRVRVSNALAPTTAPTPSWCWWCRRCSIRP